MATTEPAAEAALAQGAWSFRRVKTRARVILGTLGGMVLGTVVGIAVNKTLATTGILGPGVTTLIAEQKTNFDELNGKLEALRAASTDPAVRKAVADLAQLMQKQNELALQSQQQLQLLTEQTAAVKQRELEERGVSGGADFWLKPGESFNLGSRDQVFAVQSYYRGAVQVNLSGTAQRLNVGDVIAFKAGDRSCKVFYKQAAPRQDGRIGFDLDCA